MPTVCPAGCCSSLPSSATKTEQGLGSPCWSTMSCDFSCRAGGLDVSPAGGGGNARGSVGTEGEAQPQVMVWSKELEEKERNSKSSGRKGCWEPSSTQPVPPKVTSKSTAGPCVTSQKTERNHFPRQGHPVKQHLL